ncbi:hypothetical protein [Idiomarina seosinensis]|uniref:Uncharacterized protein n=1 Tax=Idiomarina seosinensis TaxID=281739 RepID=A0A432ZBX1_9GAMM|nr:hypothetical protein [Idiomarina seosinensis]RUO75438.1 hypothetical protein CWI81_10730 [Idiomarina seosinensis]
MEVSVELQKELIAAIASLGASKPFWESPFAVGLLTAIAAISAALIQRWQAFRLQERQSQVERQLRIHEVQMAALKSLALIEHKVTPNEEPSPGADVHEWLSPIVHSLSNVVSELDQFLKEYSYVSPTEVIVHIRASLNIANEYKWASIMNDAHDYEPTAEEIDAVVALIGELSKATESFKVNLGVTDV